MQASHLTFPDRERLDVARALATKPRLWLLDNAMAGLRSAECDAMVEFLRDINQRDGIAILLIKHIMRGKGTGQGGDRAPPRASACLRRG